MNKNLFKAIALLPILFGTMLLAVPVTGPVKTWTSGEILTSADLNSTINSLKAAIEGISTATATTTSTATSTSTSVSSQWATNGTNISYTNGNVGIGTVTPLGTLAVQGTGTGTGINFQTANSSGTSLITALDNGNVGIGTTSPTATLSVKGTGTGTGINFQTANSSGTSLITALDNGNVGIGTSSPSVTSGMGLGIVSNTSTLHAGISLNGGGSSAKKYNLLSTIQGNFSIFDSNSNVDRLIISPTGNVGIGTTSPAQLLHIKSSSQQGQIRIDANRDYTVNEAYSTSLLFATANGTLGTHDAGMIRLHHPQTIADGGFAVMSLHVGSDSSTASNSSKMLELYYDGYGSRKSVFRNGYVGIGTTSPTEKLEVNGCIKHNNGTLGTSCSSDFRLKKDISNLVFTNVLNKISAMQPKKYKYKTGEPNVYLGLVAQDVEKVAPELVGTNKEGYKTLDYTSIQWMQFQAIKELKAQHDEEKSNNDKMISNLRESNGKFEKENAELKKTLHSITSENEALKKRLDKMERAIAAIEKRM